MSNSHVHPVMQQALKLVVHVPKHTAREFVQHEDLLICNACSGSGEGYSEGSRCSACKGQGEVAGSAV